MWKFKRETIRSSSCGSKELQYWHIDLPFTMHIHPCIHAHDHIFHSLKRHDSSWDLESGEKAAIPVMMAARAPSSIAISCSCQNPCHLRQFNFPPAKNQWGPRRSRQAKVVLKPFLYDATSYHASPNLPCLKAWNSWNYGCQIRAPGSQTKLELEMVTPTWAGTHRSQSKLKPGEAVPVIETYYHVIPHFPIFKQFKQTRVTC